MTPVRTRRGGGKTAAVTYFGHECQKGLCGSLSKGECSLQAELSMKGFFQKDDDVVVILSDSVPDTGIISAANLRGQLRRTRK